MRAVIPSPAPPMSSTTNNNRSHALGCCESRINSYCSCDDKFLRFASCGSWPAGGRAAACSVVRGKRRRLMSAGDRIGQASSDGIVKTLRLRRRVFTFNTTTDGCSQLVCPGGCSHSCCARGGWGPLSGHRTRCRCNRGEHWLCAAGDVNRIVQLKHNLPFSDDNLLCHRQGSRD